MPHYRENAHDARWQQALEKVWHRTTRTPDKQTNVRFLSTRIRTNESNESEQTLCEFDIQIKAERLWGSWRDQCLATPHATAYLLPQTFVNADGSASRIYFCARSPDKPRQSQTTPHLAVLLSSMRVLNHKQNKTSQTNEQKVRLQEQHNNAKTKTTKMQQQKHTNHLQRLYFNRSCVTAVLK